MTKAQQKRRADYLEQLAKCGFRSWKRANERRFDLIVRSVRGSVTEDEKLELQQLQSLCDLYLKYKTNDAAGRAIRWIDRKIKKVETRLGIRNV